MLNFECLMVFNSKFNIKNLTLLYILIPWVNFCAFL